MFRKGLIKLLLVTELLLGPCRLFGRVGMVVRVRCCSGLHTGFV